MLMHVFWKGFWKNKKNYFLMSLSGMLLISILFSTTALVNFLNLIITGEEMDMVMSYAMTASFLTVYFLLEVLLVLSMICYMRTRAKEYAMLQVMGLKKKHRMRFVGLEYLLIVVASMTGGILIGIVESLGIQKILENLYPQKAAEMFIGFSPYKTTLINGFVEFIFLFIICDELLACLGVSEVLNMGVKTGKKPKEHPIMWKVGMVLCLAPLFILQTYWGRTSKMFPVILSIIGIYLLYVSVGGVILQRIRKKESKYYKVISWLNTWYFRFYHNINMMFIVTILIFATVFSYSLPLLDSLYMNPEEKYPYDLVWMAHEEDRPLVEELENKYGITVKEESCIQLVTPDKGTHTGIPASEYEKMTGKKAALKEDEIYIVYQRDRGFWNSLGMDFGAKDPRIHIGISESYLWINTPMAGIIPSARFDTKYPAVKSIDETITGIFSSSNDENIVVFSDEYYNKVKEKAKGPKLILMMDIPEGKEAVVEEIEHYTNRAVYDGTATRIYEKRELMAADELNKLVGMTAYLISLILIIGCSVFVTLIKIGNDSDEMEQKYNFYYLMGMKEKKRRGGIVKECMMTVWLPIVIGLIIGGLFAGVELYLRHFDVKWTLYYAAGMVVMLVIIAVIYGAVSLGINHSMIKKAERRE